MPRQPPGHTARIRDGQTWYECGETDAHGLLIWHPVPCPTPLAPLIYGAVCNALAYTDGNQTRAARLLGLTPRVLSQMMLKRGIPAGLTWLNGRQKPKVVATLLVLGLLGATAFAQTPPPVYVVPTAIEVLVLPPGTNLFATPIASRITAISPTSANCNQPLLVPLPPPLLNPTTAIFADPFHPGMTCRALLPTGLPVGTNYRAALQFLTAAGTTCTDEAGVVLTTCVSARVAALDPFSQAAIPVRPVAPGGVALRP